MYIYIYTHIHIYVQYVCVSTRKLHYFLEKIETWLGTTKFEYILPEQGPHQTKIIKTLYESLTAPFPKTDFYVHI
jgi:hypothetical protein